MKHALGVETILAFVKHALGTETILAFVKHALKGQKLLAQGNTLGIIGFLQSRPVRAKASHI